MYFKNKVHSVSDGKRKSSSSSSSSRKWNSFFSVHSFYDVIMPFFYIAKVFGYFAFTIVRTNSREKNIYRTDILDVVLFVLNIAINIAFLWTQIKFENVQPEATESLIVDIGARIVIIYSTCIAIVSSIIVFLFRRKIAKVIGQIHEVDQEVNTILQG